MNWDKVRWSGMWGSGPPVETNSVMAGDKKTNEGRGEEDWLVARLRSNKFLDCSGVIMTRPAVDRMALECTSLTPSLVWRYSGMGAPTNGQIKQVNPKDDGS